MPSKAELYEELLFQLGDLARDRLAGKPCSPRSMQRVFRAEEALLARRQELEALEQHFHTAEEAWQHFLAHNEGERAEQQGVLKRWKGRVEGVLQRSKELRRQQATLRQELHAARHALHRLEVRQLELERAGVAPEPLAEARERTDTQRQLQARLSSELEAVEHGLQQLLTPAPEDPNSPGIRAHRRLLELEQQAAARRQAHERLVEEFDQALAAKEEEVQAADAFLEQALLLLGEEVYTQRVPDPQLAVFYPRLDQVAP
jgi:hypothetical protein